MVDFEKYYYFAASEVAAVDGSTKEYGDYPYTLTVHLKSGRSLGVNYKTQRDRDEAERVLCNRIDYELRRDNDNIQSKLYLLTDTVKRIDKRQLRIWRQLQRLLEIKEEIE